MKIFDLDQYRLRREKAKSRKQITEGWDVEAHEFDAILDTATRYGTFELSGLALWLVGFRPQDFTGYPRQIYEEGLEMIERSLQLKQPLSKVRRSSPMILELMVRAQENFADSRAAEEVTRHVCMSAYRCMEEFPQFDELRRRLAKQDFDIFKTIPDPFESDTAAALWTLCCLIAEAWALDAQLEHESISLLEREYKAGTL